MSSPWEVSCRPRRHSSGSGSGSSTRHTMLLHLASPLCKRQDEGMYAWSPGPTPQAHIGSVTTAPRVTWLACSMRSLQQTWPLLAPKLHPQVLSCDVLCCAEL
jgi:hypothetical protein